ncbi:MAG: GlsB/YeaQ/YmgE family stress response membrane protein [Chloroflexales bacterium]|nr:GlsB/YeaQ/YmgE family stress response membrane protein [Chloroflexales bacterium]
MNFVLWLLFGALIGWLASLVMRTDAQQGVLLNIVVGIAGAFLGGLIFNLFGIGGSNINNSDFSLISLIVSFIGAIVLLGIVNLFRRGSVR